MNRYRRVLNLLGRLAVLGGCAFLIRQQLLALQTDHMFELLQRVGWTALLVLLPASAMSIADTLGWGACIAMKSDAASFVRLLSIRLSCDAVTNSLPAGIAPGETLRTLLLRQRCGINLTQSAACCLLGKMNMALAHMTYICVVVILLCVGVAHAIRIDSLPGGTAGLLSGAAAALLLIAILIQPYKGRRLSHTLGGISHIRWEGVRRIAQRLAPHLLQIDRQVGEFARVHPARLRRSLASFFAGWIALGSESAVILFLLGTGVSPLVGLALEGVVSALRIVFFFVPSALGAAEFAYIAFLTALGVPDPLTLSAAFITIKRSREALWILIGYAVLAKILPVTSVRRIPVPEASRI